MQQWSTTLLRVALAFALSDDASSDVDETVDAVDSEHASLVAEAHAPSRRIFADLDPANDHLPGPPVPLPACEARLKSAGIKFFSAATGERKRDDGVTTCGAPQVVKRRWGPEYIRYNRNPLVTCQMALALNLFERIVQEEARRHLGSRVRRIRTLGTYNCREMERFERLSEHSFANAIDIASFELWDGTRVDVRRDFHPRVRDTTNRKSKFLRAIARRAYDEGVFSSVITPYFDQLHANHLHLDLARYRVDGTHPGADDRPPPAR